MRSKLTGAGPAVALLISLVLPTGGLAMDGEDVYDSTCGNCHHYGASGAPRFGVESDWRPRIVQGKHMLYRHALSGYKGMPAKGANPRLTDAEVRSAVDYMVDEVSTAPPEKAVKKTSYSLDKSK